MPGSVASMVRALYDASEARDSAFLAGEPLPPMDLSGELFVPRAGRDDAPPPRGERSKIPRAPVSAAVRRLAEQFLAKRGARPDEEDDGDRGGVPRPVEEGERNDQGRDRTAGGRVAHPAPTPAQVAAGNYHKGRAVFHGLDIAIENARGSTRSGTDRDGRRWSVKMPAHYGYFNRTEGRDGDHIDVYIGPHLKSERVFVVDQVDADTGKPDEHKVMIGFGTKRQALKTYERGFSDGRGARRVGAVHECTVSWLKDWLEHGDTKKPISQDLEVGGR